MNELRWKILLVLAVVGACLWGIVPPSEKIHLGLDLKGGIHLVLRVETADAVKAQLDSQASTLRAALQRRSLKFERVAAVPQDEAIRIVGFDKVVSDEFTRIAGTELPGYSVRIDGDDLLMEMPILEVDRVKEAAVEDTLERIRVRVDAFGLAEAAVQRQGQASDRILIQIPGVDDPARVKDLVGKPAFLEFKKVMTPPNGVALRGGGESKEAVLAMYGGTLPPDVEIYQGASEGTGGRVTWWPLSVDSPVSGNDLVTARTSRGDLGSAEVQFTLTPDAGGRFESFTGSNIGQPLAALLDKRVIQVATIQAAIRESGRITGISTLQEADDLSLKLRSGALPAGTTVLEERTVGPSLGADSIRQGVIASLAGLIASIGFMLIYYKGSGVNAVVAMILNVVLIFGVMGYMGATLTLPGIAGVILTFGMALDANVLIFERIREELRLGKTVRSAVEMGFQKAFRTILDSNLTTVIAAVLLFQFGTGPIKGFAFTLIFGLAASMFTAVFVSRVMFRVLLGEGTRVQRLSI